MTTVSDFIEVPSKISQDDDSKIDVVDVDDILQNDAPKIVIATTVDILDDLKNLDDIFQNDASKIAADVVLDDLKNSDDISQNDAPKIVAAVDILDDLKNLDARMAFDSMHPINDKISWDEFSKWYSNFSKEKVTEEKKRLSSSSSSSTMPAKKKNASEMMMAASSGSSVVIPKAKKAALLKSLITGLKASIKGKKFYSGYSGRSEDCSSDVVMSFDEFLELFGSVGTTPADAKEKSVVKIKILSKGDIVSVFGSLASGLTTPTVSRPRNFSKQYKTGTKNIVIESAHITFSTNTSNCKVKFNVHTEAEDGDENDDGERYFFF